MAVSYADKLKDPRWQKRRLEIMRRDNFACRCCKDATKTLHVHHLIYARGCDPWAYSDDFLVTVCEDCHEKLDEYVKMMAVALAWANNFDLKAIKKVVRDSKDRWLPLMYPEEAAKRQAKASGVGGGGG